MLPPIRSRFFAIAVGLSISLSTIISEASAASQRIRYITFNVDFNNSAAQIDSDIQALKSQADIVFFQEAKWVTIANSFGSGFTVHQVTTQGDAKQGSAIAVRNSAISNVLASGLRLGVDNHGEEMLDRYIAWADVTLTNNLVIRIMSLHMPPGRFQYLQPIMADNLATFVAESPYPVIVGADWNFTVNNDPYNIQGDTGLTPKGIGIDGFYYDSSITTFVSIAELTGLNVNSDHDPVKMTADMDVPTYIIDNSNAGFSASTNWSTGTSAADKYGSNYRFRLTAQESDVAEWTKSVTPGTYGIYAWWSQGANRSTTAPFILPDNTTVYKNQQTAGGQWNLLGTQTLSGSATTKLSCWTTTGFVVIADAIKLAP